MKRSPSLSLFTRKLARKGGHAEGSGTLPIVLEGNLLVGVEGDSTAPPGFSVRHCVVREDRGPGSVLEILRNDKSLERGEPPLFLIQLASAELKRKDSSLEIAVSGGVVFTVSADDEATGPKLSAWADVLSIVIAKSVMRSAQLNSKCAECGGAVDFLNLRTGCMLCSADADVQRYEVSPGYDSVMSFGSKRIFSYRPWASELGNEVARGIFEAACPPGIRRPQMNSSVKEREAWFEKKYASRSFCGVESEPKEENASELFEFVEKDALISLAQAVLRGADLGVLNAETGETLLQAAVRSRSSKSALFLLHHGGDVKVEDSDSVSVAKKLTDWVEEAGRTDPLLQELRIMVDAVMGVRAANEDGDDAVVSPSVDAGRSEDGKLGVDTPDRLPLSKEKVKSAKGKRSLGRKSVSAPKVEWDDLQHESLTTGNEADVSLAGWLRIGGKTRWCCVAGSSFEVYASETDFRKGGKSVVKQVVGLLTAAVKAAPSGGKFDIVSPSGVLQCAEATAKDSRGPPVGAWMAAIQTGVGEALAGSAPRAKSGEAENAPEQTPEKDSKKSEMEKLLRAVAGNDCCADCGAIFPTWSSINLGVLLCLECSGIHRSLSTSISKVRSLDLDAWEDSLHKMMISLGNSFVNGIFEGSLTEGATKPGPNAERAVKEDWIRRKYAFKAFCSRSLLPPEDLVSELHDACESSNVAKAAQAVAWGADIEGHRDGKTPLASAIAVTAWPVALYLMNNSAELRIAVEGVPLLKFAEDAGMPPALLTQLRNSTEGEKERVEGETNLRFGIARVVRKESVKEELKGWLKSKAGKRRFCVVGSETFDVFKGDDVASLLAGTVDSFNLLTIGISHSVGAKRFEVTGASGVVPFEAENADAAKRWVHEIEKAKSAVLVKAMSDAQKGDNALISGQIAYDRLRRVTGNHACADCSRLNPQWASLNRGALYCDDCTAVHRHLGMDVSRFHGLKAVDLISDMIVKMLHSLGNWFVNKIFEAELEVNDARKPGPDAERSIREEFIRRKYLYQSFMEKTILPPEEQLDALHAACLADDVQAVARPVFLGADIEGRIDGCTPVCSAVRAGHFTSALFLLYAGADLAARVSDGRDVVNEARTLKDGEDSSPAAKEFWGILVKDFKGEISAEDSSGNQESDESLRYKALRFASRRAAPSSARGDGDGVSFEDARYHGKLIWSVSGSKKKTKGYVVLHDDALELYKSSEDTGAPSHIAADVLKMLTCHFKPLDEKRFELVFPAARYTFEAESKDGVVEWQKQISDAIARGLDDVQSTKARLAEAGGKARWLDKEEVVRRLRDVPGNAMCADCSAPNPAWVLLNWGVCVCIECSGVHRSLGPNVSKVRSMTLDEWSTPLVELMESLGNDFVNSAIMSSVDEPMRPVVADDRDSHISRKYVSMEWLAKHEDGVEEGERLPSCEQEVDVRSVFCEILRGADVNEGIDGFESAMEAAVHFHREKVVLLLLLRGADFDSRMISLARDEHLDDEIIALLQAKWEGDVVEPLRISDLVRNNVEGNFGSSSFAGDAMEDETDTELSGYVRIVGQRHRQYCVIKEGELLIHKSESEALGSPVWGNEFESKKGMPRRIQLVASRVRSLPAQNRFEIQSGGARDVVLFETSTTPELLRWVRAIEIATGAAMRATLTGSAPAFPEHPLRFVPGNDGCGDCGLPDPNFASLTYGMLLCGVCGSLHRSVLSGKDRIRRMQGDTRLSELDLDLLCSMGNSFANSLLESNVSGKSGRPEQNSPPEAKVDWIRKKYVMGKFKAMSLLQVEELGPLLEAAVAKDDVREVFRLLLEGADPDGDVNGAPLASAVRYGSWKSALLLLSSSASVAVADKWAGGSLRGAVESEISLLEHEIDVLSSQEPEGNADEEDEDESDESEPEFAVADTPAPTSASSGRTVEDLETERDSAREILNSIGAVDGWGGVGGGGATVKFSAPGRDTAAYSASIPSPLGRVDSGPTIHGAKSALTKSGAFLRRMTSRSKDEEVLSAVDVPAPPPAPPTLAGLGKVESTNMILLSGPGNDACAECVGRPVVAVSRPYGVRLCSGCAASHIALECSVHFLDKALPSVTVQTWAQLDNVFLNSMWESSPVSSKPDAGSSLSDREQWVKKKYIFGSFRGQSVLPPEELLSALRFACIADDVRDASSLIVAGADIEGTIDGRTPLLICLADNAPRVAALLFFNGADVSVKGSDGRRAREIGLTIPGFAAVLDLELGEKDSVHKEGEESEVKRGVLRFKSPRAHPKQQEESRFLKAQSLVEGWLSVKMGSPANVKSTGSISMRKAERRYVSLVGGAIELHANPESCQKESPPIFSAPLSTAIVRPVVAVPTRFEIVVGERALLCETDSGEMRDVWLRALERSISGALDSAVGRREERRASSATLDQIDPDIYLSREETIRILQAVPGNSKCADCLAENPTWASISFGILVCLECSGIHRSLGPNVSKVRSLTLDVWHPALVSMMVCVGNTVSGSVLEALRPYDKKGDRLKPHASSDQKKKQAYIRKKYVELAFVGPAKEGENPSLSLCNCAAENDVIGCLGALVRGADLEAVNDKGQTPLLASVLAEPVAASACLFLLRRGAKVSVFSNSGETALELLNGRKELEYHYAIAADLSVEETKGGPRGLPVGVESDSHEGLPETDIENVDEEMFEGFDDETLPVVDPLPDGEESLAAPLLFEVQGNRSCADCFDREPEWFNLSLGVCLCLDCAIVHRRLGLVRSMFLHRTRSKMIPPVVSILCEIGNSWVNRLLYAKRDPRFNPMAFRMEPRERRVEFIRKKYQDREFVSDEERSRSLDDLRVEMKGPISRGFLRGAARAVLLGVCPSSETLSLSIISRSVPLIIFILCNGANAAAVHPVTKKSMIVIALENGADPVICSILRRMVASGSPRKLTWISAERARDPESFDEGGSSHADVESPVDAHSDNRVNSHDDEPQMSVDEESGPDVVAE